MLVPSSPATTLRLSDRRILSTYHEFLVHNTLLRETWQTSDMFLFLRLNIHHLKSIAIPLNPFWTLIPDAIDNPRLIALSHRFHFLDITCLLPNCQIVITSSDISTVDIKNRRNPRKKRIQNCLLESNSYCNWRCRLRSVGRDPLLEPSPTLVESEWGQLHILYSKP